MAQDAGVFAEMLREELQVRGWTAQALARRGGCHVWRVQRLLAGGAPTWCDALAIARATGGRAGFWMRLWGIGGRSGANPAASPRAGREPAGRGRSVQM